MLVILFLVSLLLLLLLGGSFGDGKCINLYVSIVMYSISFLDKRRLPRNHYLLERILELIILSHKVLSPLLGNSMLDNHLLAHLLHISSDESRIPQLGRYTQILAAPHEGV
jgi:hypothetical protein